MAARGTFDSKRAQARELYDEGYSCNAIAQKLSASPSTVSRWAKAEGLLFDRSQTEMAVRAHTIDMAADRIVLTKLMMVNAIDSLQMLDHPFEVFNFGGKDNAFNSRTLESAPIEARRSAQMIAGVAFDKATKVVEATPEGLRGAESLIDRLEAGLSKFDDNSDDDDLAV